LIVIENQLAKRCQSRKGTSIEDAKNNIKNLNQNISNKPFVINIDKNNKIYINNSLDKIVNIDQTKAIQNIENSNQNITLLEYPLQIFKNLFLQKNITNEILQINKDKINKILTENIKNTNLAKQEYNIIYLNDNFYISDKRDGIKIKQENFANKFFTEENFQENSEVNIYPDREIDIAERKKEEVAPFILIAQELKTKIKPITLSYFSNLRNVNKNYILENEDILKSLSVKERGGNLYLGIDESSLLKNLELMKNEIYID
jgi:hypothetical protein